MLRFDERATEQDNASFVTMVSHPFSQKISRPRPPVELALNRHVLITTLIPVGSFSSPKTRLPPFASIFLDFCPMFFTNHEWWISIVVNGRIPINATPPPIPFDDWRTIVVLLMKKLKVDSV
ncbi:hypothetical protein BLNAU_20268 [Blattamonas nauphoetae]|uniref:Uncharacterized protein n=1 Tax=Blattamonas nauphoetae TaxID=2049346 RepID=A0ABQ9WZ57_9EUKA|nr:hypothetical protein BLNAU_20268 [Blattamonas nauphoetae]